ncbi:MAG: Isochorismatase, partial [uncultured Pseudonocardia sp.]
GGRRRRARGADPPRPRAGRVGAAEERGVPARQRRLAHRPRGAPGRERAPHREGARRLVRGDRPGGGAGRGGRRPGRRRGHPDRRLHPGHAARRVRARLRHHPRHRRPHHASASPHLNSTAVQTLM